MIKPDLRTTRGKSWLSPTTEFTNTSIQSFEVCRSTFLNWIKFVNFNVKQIFGQNVEYFGTPINFRTFLRLQSSRKRLKEKFHSKWHPKKREDIFLLFPLRKSVTHLVSSHPPFLSLSLSSFWIDITLNCSPFLLLSPLGSLKKVLGSNKKSFQL